MTETRLGNASRRHVEATGRHTGGLLKGLVGGALIGTAAGVFFAPRIYAVFRNLRRHMAEAAADASGAAAEGYQEATTRVGEAVDDLHQKGRGVYEKALNVVVRGAQEITERATEAQTELKRGDETRRVAR
jgi:gas vesicle protein